MNTEPFLPNTPTCAGRTSTDTQESTKVPQNAGMDRVVSLRRRRLGQSAAQGFSGPRNGCLTSPQKFHLMDPERVFFMAPTAPTPPTAGTRQERGSEKDSKRGLDMGFMAMLG